MNDTTKEALIAEARTELDEGLHERGTVAVDMIALVSFRGYDADGDQVTQTVILPEGPLYAMLGLLDEARIRFNADALDGYR